MWTRVKAAATEGLLLGVKYAVVIAVLGATLLLLAGDYAVTRQNAAFAASTLQRLMQQQAAAQAAPAPAK